MADILHRLSIDAPRDRVRELVATPAGVEQWWTGHPVRGDGGVGATMQIFFGGPDPAAVVEVTEDGARPHRNNAAPQINTALPPSGRRHAAPLHAA